MKHLLHVSLCLLFPLFCFGSEVSLKEMISQMIMVGFEGTKTSDKWANQIRIDISKKRIGGVLLLEKNIGTPQELKELTRSFLSTSSLPTLIAIDQEGGYVSRLTKEKGYKTYPSARVIGQEKNIDEAYKIYKDMALYLKSFGINYNLAPVVDITSKKSNFQKKRTFDKYPSIISTYAQSFLDAFNEVGVLTSLKHFPGYGNSSNDTHKNIADTTDTWDYDELLPYFDSIEAKSVKSIMTGHTYLKKFDTKYPSSLSKIIINDILREELKYQGVVICDDLLMDGLQNFSIKERIILSINAGVDILLFSNYFLLGASTPKVATNIILEAIEQGKIQKAQIIKSYNRIIKMKKWLK